MKEGDMPRYGGRIRTFTGHGGEVRTLSGNEGCPGTEGGDTTGHRGRVRTLYGHGGGGLAQMVEQVSLDTEDAGSNPAPPSPLV